MIGRGSSRIALGTLKSACRAMVKPTGGGYDSEQTVVDWSRCFNVVKRGAGF